MANSPQEFLSDFAQRFIARGRAEGFAHAVLTVLGVRGISVPDHVRWRLLECRDLDRLDGWLARAVTASSAVDVVAD